MKKAFICMLVFLCVGFQQAAASGLDEAGRALEALGAGDLLSQAGLDLDKAAGLLDWERLNVSLKADMETVVHMLGTTTRVDATVYKQGITAVRIDIKGGLQVRDGGRRLEFPGCYILEYPLRDKAFLVFPRRSGYLELDPERVRDLLGDQLDKSRKNPGRVEKKERLGVEAVDGHACDRMHFVQTTGKGARNDITAWLAKDLGGFPLKTLVDFETPRGRKGSASVIFRNIVKAAQDDALFELPGGYAQYDNLVELATRGRAGSRLGRPDDRPGVFKRRGK